MNKYQIVEIGEQLNHAGTKATADIAKVADALGFEDIYIRMATCRKGFLGKIQRQIGFFGDWNKCYSRIEEGSVVLLQHPFHYPQLTRERILRKIKEIKKAKIISLVHDVEELRAFRFNDYYAGEFRAMTDIADVLIVHNENMKQWFVERGIDSDRIVCLGIFDYLQAQGKKNLPAYEKCITIAGNLDTTKCGYIIQLNEIPEVGVKLYGPNFDEKMKDYPNVSYEGSFPSDEIPQKLQSGFGLVWDGDSINGCQGLSGQYLRYNNPHKLSLYLSSGLPVVVWKDAAVASFIEQNHVGICVDKLQELPEVFKKISESDYIGMAQNVRELSRNLCNGQYAAKAIKEALKKLSANEE